MNLDPLNLQTNPEFRDMRIETVTLFPRSFADQGSNGGQCSFVFPKRGYLSGESRIILPAICANNAYQYPPSAGVFSLIRSASLQTESSGVIAQVDNAGELYSLINNLEHCEKKDRVDNVLHGVNFSFETASGSKKTDVDGIEKLAGQYRLVVDEYKKQAPSTVTAGDSDNRANQMSAKPKTLLKTFYDDKSDEAGTPEYSISLAQLFPGFFKEGYQLPLALIAEEVLLEINFSSNGDFGNNDRAIYCPDKSTETADAMIAVAVVQVGSTGVAGTGEENKVLSSPTGSAAGTGLRLTCDVPTTIGGVANNTGLITNIRILDTGSGYVEGEQLEFDVSLLGDKLVVEVGRKFKSWDVSNNTDVLFYITDGGAGYADGDILQIQQPGQELNPLKVKVNSNAGGVISKVQLIKEDDNNQLIIPLAYCNGANPPEELSSTVVSGGGNGAASFLLVNAEINGTSSDLAANQTFGVGDMVAISGRPNNSRFIVSAITADPGGSGNNVPTQLLCVGSDNTFVKNTPVTIVKHNDAAQTCTFLPANDDTGVVQNTEVVGLGFDPVYSYGSGGDKINVVEKGCVINTDLIFYEDGKFQADQAQMMNKGINYVYTQFRNITSTLEDQGAITAYGNREPREYNRLVGFSNEILRTLVWNIYPSGKQNREGFPYYNNENGKLNPLLNKYCSRSSLVKDGQAYNINVNSIPYYSSRVETDMRAFTELNKCFDRMFYINKGCYQGWAQCRQDSQTADLSNAAPSTQPGFTTNDSIIKPTLQYEINERKAGIVCDAYEGVPQKYMRGQYHPQGVSFKVSPLNQLGNGVAIGSTSVDVQLTHNDTYNPYYSGSATLSLYGEVERVFSLKMGRISVTAASM